MEQREHRIIIPQKAQLLQQRLAGNREIGFIGVNSKILKQSPIGYWMRGTDKDSIQYTAVVGALDTTTNDTETLNYLFDTTLEELDHYTGESAYGIDVSFPHHFALKVATLREIPIPGADFANTYFSIFPSIEIARSYIQFLEQIYHQVHSDYGNFTLMQLYNNLVTSEKLGAWIDLEDMVSTEGLQKTLTLGKMMRQQGHTFEL